MGRMAGSTSSVERSRLGRDDGRDLPLRQLPVTRLNQQRGARPCRTGARMSEIVDWELGETFRAEDGRKGLVAGGQFGMGRGGAPVDRAKAHCQLILLAVRVIGTFGVPVHLLRRTQGLFAGSVI